MADKQIIIDGVNVRECECIIEDYYYQQANNLANGYKHIKNVCELGESGSEYYKLFCKDNPNCYYKQLTRKEQECEEFKKQVEVFTRQLEKANKEVIKEKIENATQRQKNEKLKQTLIEIKDIAEEDFNHTCWEAYARQLKQILQKISEYEGEYNEKIR